jgi:hypothetical protein
MWSLGACLKKMCRASDGSYRIDHPLLKDIIEGLDQVEWKNRFDANQLSQELESFSSSIDVSQMENDYLIILRKKTYDDNQPLLDLYKKSNMPKERLEIASYFMNKFIHRSQGRVDDNNWEEYDNLLYKQGTKY